MSPLEREDGFTMIELLVAIVLFSVLSIGFYQVMFGSIRGSETSQSLAAISQEARIGFNRMLRETRESDELIEFDNDSFIVWVDYDRDGVRESDTTVDPAGEYDEYLRFTFDGAAGTVSMATMTTTTPYAVIDGPEVLMDNVTQVPGVDAFSYSSNHLEFDSSPSPTPDGYVSTTELAINAGDRDSNFEQAEYIYLSDVHFVLQVSVEDRSTQFVGEASLRNKRFGT